MATAPVRVALLTHEPFYPPTGGGSAAAVYLVRELKRRGHDVEVFAPASAPAAEVEERFGIRMRPFRQWAMGRTTPLRTPKYLAYPKALAWQVVKASREGARWDVIVAQHAIASVAAGELKSRLGVPVVFNLLDCLTGFMETWPPYLMPRPVARSLVRYELSLPQRYQADRVLTVSDPLKERIVATGFPEDRVRPIYYGYDAELFQAPAVRETRETNPIVVMHGSFDHHHLGRIARQAIAMVAQARSDVRFRFIGPGTGALQDFLKKLRRHHPAASVEVLGFVPYEQIPSRLAEAAVGITPYEPSTGTHCAFVAKTVEYLAVGLPVVSTPLESAVRYYEGLRGIHFSSADGTGFGWHLLELLNLSPAERRALVEDARKKVQQELDWPVVCGRAAEFIEEAASGSDRGAAA